VRRSKKRHSPVGEARGGGGRGARSGGAGSGDAGRARRVSRLGMRGGERSVDLLDH
jgi:hypothetical protein